MNDKENGGKSNKSIIQLRFNKARQRGGYMSLQNLGSDSRVLIQLHVSVMTENPWPLIEGIHMLAAQDEVQQNVC